jgi:hypothetical protein
MTALALFTDGDAVYGPSGLLRDRFAQFVMTPAGQANKLSRLGCE